MGQNNRSTANPQNPKGVPDFSGGGFGGKPPMVRMRMFESMAREDKSMKLPLTEAGALGMHNNK